MNLFTKLSFTLIATLILQLVFVGCDSTEVSLTQIAPESSTILTTETVTISVASVGSGLTYYWQVNDGVATTTSSNSWTYNPSSAGTYTISVWAVDDGGSTSNTLQSIITVQNGNPVITASLDNSYLESAGNVKVTISASGSGNTYYFQLDSESSKSSTSSSSYTFNISSEGSHSIKAWITNSDGIKSNTVSLSVFMGSFPIHSNITASTFWCGEGASGDNDFITNTHSAWDSHWGEHFGLEDKPLLSRDGDFIPTSGNFTGDENPYYFALPYNDYGKLVYDGKNAKVDTAAVDGYGHKKNAYNVVYWADEKTNWNNYSMCKNRWIKIMDRSSGKTAYAQWEDSGPYYYNDHNYVFGTGSPANTTDSPYAGIDLSPSVCLYFNKPMQSWGAADFKVNWQFVDESEVPDGPWKKHVTTRQVSWN